MPVRTSAVVLFVAIFAFALGLRAAFPAVPAVLIANEPFASFSDVGAAAFLNRPLPEANVMALGIPSVNEAYGAIAREYILQAGKQSTGRSDLVVFVPQGLKTGIESVTFYDSDPPKMNVLFAKLVELINQKKRILIVLPSADASHRLTKNFMIQLEAFTNVQIPSLILAEIALDKQSEVNLQPVCRASLRDGEGGVFDLGCLILTISRKFQAKQTGFERSFLYAEAEMKSENILALYVAPQAVEKGGEK